MGIAEGINRDEREPAEGFDPEVQPVPRDDPI